MSNLILYAIPVSVLAYAIVMSILYCYIWRRGKVKEEEVKIKENEKKISLVKPTKNKQINDESIKESKSEVSNRKTYNNDKELNIKEIKRRRIELNEIQNKGKNKEEDNTEYKEIKKININNLIDNKLEKKNTEYRNNEASFKLTTQRSGTSDRVEPVNEVKEVNALEMRVLKKLDIIGK